MSRPVWPLAGLALLTLSTAAVAAPAPHRHPRSRPHGPAPTLILDGSGAGVLKLAHGERDASTPPGFLTLRFAGAQNLITLDARGVMRELRDLKGLAFLQASPTLFRGWFDVHAPLPPVLTDAALDADGNYHQDASSWGTAGHLAAHVAHPDAAWPVRTCDLESHTTIEGYRTASGDLHFALAGDAVKTAVLPEFRSIHVNLSQAGNVTKMVASLTLPGTTGVAEEFKQIAADPAGFQQKLVDELRHEGLNVQSVQLANARATDSEVGADLTITLVDLDQTVQGLVRNAIAKMPQSATTEQTWQKGLAEMLEVRLDSLDVQGAAVEDRLDVTVKSHVSNLDHFVLGYLDVEDSLLTMIDTEAHKDKHHKPGNMDPVFDMLMRAGHLSVKRVRPVFEAAASGPADRHTWSGALHYVHDATQDTLNGTLDGGGDLKGLTQALQAAHIPLMEGHQGHFTVHSDGKTVDGKGDLSLAGPWIDVIKAPYIQAALETPGMEKFAALLPVLTVDDARAALTLDGGNVTTSSYLQSPGLGLLANGLLARACPGFKGTVSGAALSLQATGTRFRAFFNVYLAGLPTTVHDAVADVMRLPVVRKAGHPKVVQGDASQPPVTRPQVAEPPH